MSLTHLSLGLRWEASSRCPHGIDLDLTCFMLGAEKSIPHEKYMLYFHNSESADGAVRHSGDDRVGEKGEQLHFDLTKVDAAIEEIIFVASIYDEGLAGFTFGHCARATLILQDTLTSHILLAWEIHAQFSENTAIEIGRLFRRTSGWRFESLGVGYKAMGLAKFVDKYVV